MGNAAKIGVKAATFGLLAAGAGFIANKTLDQNSDYTSGTLVPGGESQVRYLDGFDLASNVITYSAEDGHAKSVTVTLDKPGDYEIEVGAYPGPTWIDSLDRLAFKSIAVERGSEPQSVKLDLASYPDTADGIKVNVSRNISDVPFVGVVYSGEATFEKAK